MIGAMYLVTSGALVNQKRLEVLSNNLANVNTSGYKSDRVIFRMERFRQQDQQTAATVAYPAQNQTRPLWLDLDVYTDFSSGPLQKTGNGLDLALIGDGFFCVETPDGTRYTRNGQFRLNSDNELVTAGGHRVLGEGGTIEIDGDPVSVDRNGRVSVGGNVVDRLRIVRFERPESLIKHQESLFMPADQSVSAEETDDVQVSQGFVEKSNVSPVRMITEMIEVLRGYESYQKAIRAVDDATAKVIQDVGRV